MISEPEDYGLTDAETLAHTRAATRPDRFDDHWSAFREEIAALPRCWRGSIDVGENTVEITSMRHVRVVARVTAPEHSPRVVLVTTHGSTAADDFDEDDTPRSKAGMAVIRLRVRGYPPSVQDVPDSRDEWILQGIEDDEAWILRGAVGDLVQTVRCARAAFGEQTPVMLHGESFGGGLAVLATAQLQAMDEQPHRLAIGLPTFGYWRWRVGRYCNGVGGQVNWMLDLLRNGARDAILDRLDLYDAALHASDIDVPCVCKLALRDDAVPAPSAAAIFNGFASSNKHRFVTRYGHFDGGIANARRHLLFDRLVSRFVDPATSVEDALEGIALNCS